MAYPIRYFHLIIIIPELYNNYFSNILKVSNVSAV